MGLDSSYNNINEVLSLLQKYKQKMITHNYTNKFYNMIYIRQVMKPLENIKFWT